jgi:hypothetical protein
MRQLAPLLVLVPKLVLVLLLDVLLNLNPALVPEVQMALIVVPVRNVPRVVALTNFPPKICLINVGVTQLVVDIALEAEAALMYHVATSAQQ